MSDIQYTIRSVPPKADKYFRSLAKKRGTSLNHIMIELMDIAVKRNMMPLNGDADLDWFMGSGALETSVTDAIMQAKQDDKRKQDAKYTT